MVQPSHQRLDDGRLDVSAVVDFLMSLLNQMVASIPESGTPSVCGYCCSILTYSAPERVRLKLDFIRYLMPIHAELVLTDEFAQQVVSGKLHCSQLVGQWWLTGCYVLLLASSERSCCIIVHGSDLWHLLLESTAIPWHGMHGGRESDS